MGPRIIEVANVLGEYGEQLALGQDDQVVDALAAYAAEKALAGRVHVRRMHRGLDDPRPETLGSAIEISSEFVVSVADEESRTLSERCRIAKLLSGPLLSWSPRYRDGARPRECRD